ncbi:MAG: hypothetical protein Satyrvirus11_10 [Satyrvirus sp.]|uniref:Uncharacterized protein n=1 Tax=Satyrvirus sp. TaxID=2487771 RepID=A0A3G5ADY1_9VIRU|nr:MAG: hypothetical protein Satyrvirus11_10 [Satyrvirus sp.]
MGKNDHSYYDIHVADGNLDGVKKYFKALINGFGHCGRFGFSLDKTESDKEWWVPNEISEMDKMIETLKNFLGDKVNSTFDLRINYSGSTAPSDVDSLYV